MKKSIVFSKKLSNEITYIVESYCEDGVITKGTEEIVADNLSAAIHDEYELLCDQFGYKAVIQFIKNNYL